MGARIKAKIALRNFFGEDNDLKWWALQGLNLRPLPCEGHVVVIFQGVSGVIPWHSSIDYKQRKTALRRSLKSHPRRSLGCLGFLNGIYGVADHVQHSLWLGEHRDVTGAQLDDCGAHALCNEAL